MKMAKLFISKGDLAEKWGLNTEDFIIGQVRGEYDSIEFDVIFTSDVEVKEIQTVDYVDSIGQNLRRQRL